MGKLLVKNWIKDNFWWRSRKNYQVTDAVVRLAEATQSDLESINERLTNLEYVVWPNEIEKVLIPSANQSKKEVKE